MFAQLFLGVFFVVKGIAEHYVRKPNFFVYEAMIQNTPKEDLSSYLKKVGKAHIALGVLIVTMGQIEYRYDPELWIFLVTYIILGLGCLSRIFYLNKRYSA